jgi:hypothetical protein
MNLVETVFVKKLRSPYILHILPQIDIRLNERLCMDLKTELANQPPLELFLCWIQPASGRMYLVILR